MKAEFPVSRRNRQILDQLARAEAGLAPPRPMASGRLTQMVGLTLEAVGCSASVGSRCRIRTSTNESIEAEVVGFSAEKLFLMPIGRVRGMSPNSRVIPMARSAEVGTGDRLLGRIVGGSGEPIDDRGDLGRLEYVPMHGQPINPLHRTPISEPLDVGVRAINGLLTIGRGQRVGLFAGSGVGKSILMGLMAKFTAANVVVVALIGERGREVKEFVDQILGPEGLAKAVVVATPADDPPLMRLHGAWRATAIAEYFRDQGLQVLLLMDSLTRFAQAQREISLAIGEPPVTRGYPPTVFTQIPHLVERAGNGTPARGGSITAIYTVLVEGDDQNDPIADSARAILDGHIVLSRGLADMGVYPAIDIEASISRSMVNVAERQHLMAARRFKQIYSVYQQNRDLIAVGAYNRGSDRRIDQAISLFPALQKYIMQDAGERATWAESINGLAALSSKWEEG